MSQMSQNDAFGSLLHGLPLQIWSSATPYEAVIDPAIPYVIRRWYVPVVYLL